jgi:two-component system chemotaxis response regulator CheB
MSLNDKIKVLVVDDSSLMRKVITDMLQKDPDIVVVGTSNNGRSAITRNEELEPDIITMDVEMPIMDGLGALRRIMESRPTPVIMVSVLTQHGAETTFKALEMGAVDFVPKPSAQLALSNDEIGDLLISKVKGISKYKFEFAKNVYTRSKEIISSQPIDNKPVNTTKIESNKTHSDKIVAIGTSTGGPQALVQVFKLFPENFPAPVVVVQHMPEGFTTSFGERLNAGSTLNVKEASDGDILKPGCGYLAPGHSHMEIAKQSSGEYRICLSKTEKVSGHRPSIDVLFRSVAKNSGAKSVAVIMTGMGRDGASGIGEIKKTGGFTLAQNEETSVVYGMNRAAVEEGGINEVVPLIGITKKIVDHI